MKNVFIRIATFMLNSVTLPEFLRVLLMWPIATRVLGEDYSEPFRLKAGFSMHAYLGDQLGRLALFFGTRHEYFWEPVTTQLLAKLVPGRKHVVVAGAHIGLTALYARRAMGATGVVHTFEPIPHLFLIAERNLGENAHLGRVVLTRSALGDAPGTVTMTRDRIRSRIIQQGKHRPGLSTEEVPVTTLDAYFARAKAGTPDVVFLDVEGYELRVLRGMEGMLRERPPVDIIYEISFPYKDNLAAARDIGEYLGSFGYDFYIIEDDYNPTQYALTIPPIILTPATEEAYEAHRAFRYFNVYATKRTDEDVRAMVRA